MGQKPKKWTPEFEKEWQREYRKRNKVAIYAQIKRWKQVNSERAKVLNKEERNRLKFLVLSHYSGGVPHCATCFFSDIDALCLDHIDNNGAEHRRSNFGNRTMAGTTFYRWVKKNNFPSGFQVLCANCNLVKSIRWLRK